MRLLRTRKGCDLTMKKKIVTQCIGAVLASIIFATYPISLVGAQMTPAMKDGIPNNETSSISLKELTGQGLNLEQLYCELQNMYGSIHTDNQNREQSSLSLRDFSENHLFSCRGFA
jgi:hypothetical protein